MNFRHELAVHLKHIVNLLLIIYDIVLKPYIRLFQCDVHQVGLDFLALIHFVTIIQLKVTTQTKFFKGRYSKILILPDIIYYTKIATRHSFQFILLHDAPN